MQQIKADLPFHKFRTVTK